MIILLVVWIHLYSYLFYLFSEVGVDILVGGDDPRLDLKPQVCHIVKLGDYNSTVWVCPVIGNIEEKWCDKMCNGK